MITLVAPNGELHGLLESLPNSCPDNDFKNADPSIKESLKKKKKDDAKLVKCRYINYEEGDKGRLEKPYCKYAGDSIQKWRFIHDYEYTVPMGLVEEVNESRMPVRSGLQSVDGKEVNRDGSPLNKDKIKRVHEMLPIGFN